MCVAIRSRNQRSWLITTAQPPKLSSASSRARRVHVEIVRGFIEQYDVRAALQGVGEMRAVPLAS